MREFVRSVSGKGQVTIPAELRRRLGVGSPGHISFVIDQDGRIELKPGPMSLDEVYGSVPALPGRDPETSRSSSKKRWRLRPN